MIFAPRKTPFEAAGTLSLFTASEFVLWWRLSWLCDCWELDIKWTLLMAGGAVICWAFWDWLDAFKIYDICRWCCSFADLYDWRLWRCCDSLVEPQKSLEYLHEKLLQRWPVFVSSAKHRHYETETLKSPGKFFIYGKLLRHTNKVSLRFVLRDTLHEAFFTGHQESNIVDNHSQSLRDPK